MTLTQKVLAVVGALIGAVSFTGSLIAFAKLQGWMDKTFRFNGQQAVNGLCFPRCGSLGGVVVYQMQPQMIVLFFRPGVAVRHPDDTRRSAAPTCRS